ncbi:MAG TPA: DICT sensory domain-containing protein [Polyangiales bacterium]|nr:DICT sensory domain-containing protein [Polyangiales bacterium]
MSAVTVHAQPFAATQGTQAVLVPSEMPEVDHSLKHFSFHDWVAQAAQSSQVELRHLGDAPALIEPRVQGKYTAGVRAMLHWCRINEQLTLERYAPEASVYVGFERASRVKPVLKRYQKLAEQSKELVLFAELDVPVPLDASCVDVTGCALAREWFLVIHSPNYHALLVARDLDGFGPTGPLQGRRFSGLTLHDSGVIGRAIQELKRCVGTAS